VGGGAIKNADEWWRRLTTHGYRIELDRIIQKLDANGLAKDIKSGARLRVNGFKNSSDIDVLDSLLSESIKRSGRTLKNWKTDDILMHWIIAAAKKYPDRKVKFVMGDAGEAINKEAIDRLDRVKALMRKDRKTAEYIDQIAEPEFIKVLPPPALKYK